MTNCTEEIPLSTLACWHRILSGSVYTSRSIVRLIGRVPDFHFISVLVVQMDKGTSTILISLFVIVSLLCYHFYQKKRNLSGLEPFDTNMFTGALNDDSAALKDAPLDITFIDQSSGRTSVFQVQSMGLFQSPIQQFTRNIKEKEAIARSSRIATAENYAEKLPALYSRFLMDFLPEEKTAITSIIQGNQQLRTFSWHFMKMEDTMEFARPFIFGNTIVLSASACKKFADPKTDQDASDNKSLLMRYQIYLQQLADPEKYESIYETLKPQDALVNNTPADPIWTKAPHLQIPAEVSEIMYTDPNTTGRYWLFRSGSDLYWPGLFIDKEFKLVQLAFRIEKDKNDGFVVVNESVDLVKDFSKLFNGSDLYYHPACQLAGNPMALKLDLLLKFSGSS
jgi:hypothetical protein